MPDFEPSFDDIRRSDAFLDALATGRPVAPQDQADAALATLLGNWRDENRFPPADGLITERDAVAALDAGLSEKPARARRDKPAVTGPPRRRRGLSVVGSVAAAALFVGGFGAVVAGSGPGDALYGLRSMLFGSAREVRDDPVALAARTELQQVQEMISRGDWEQAQQKLVAVSTQVEAVGDQTQKQELLEEFNELSAKVVERNPEATAPPGVVFTVPPEATTLVSAPAPTSTPGAPPTSGEATTSGEPTSGAQTSAATTGAQTSPATSDAQTSAATTGAQTSPATTDAQTSAATTTPTSAAPATSATTPAPATTSAPAAAAETSAQTSAQTSAEVTATTTPPKAEATSEVSSEATSEATAETTTATTAAPAAASETTATTTAAPATTTAEEAPASQPEIVGDPATTTLLVPVPAG